jgi:hypothetical protein
MMSSNGRGNPMSSLFFPCYGVFGSLLPPIFSLFRDQGNHRQTASIAMTCEISRGPQTRFFPVNARKTGKNGRETGKTRQRRRLLQARPAI